MLKTDPTKWNISTLFDKKKRKKIGGLWKTQNIEDRAVAVQGILQQECMLSKSQFIAISIKKNILTLLDKTLEKVILLQCLLHHENF